MTIEGVPIGDAVVDARVRVELRTCLREALLEVAELVGEAGR